MPALRITLDGKLALTVEMAAERYGLQPSSMRAAISRNTVEPDHRLDRRTPLYLQARLDAIMKARPGKGANLRAENRGQMKQPIID